MATFTKEILSSSANGQGILIAATATAGTLIHTGSTTVTDLDEVWLWAVNSGSTDTKLTIEWLTATATDNIEVTIPYESGLYQVIPGLLVKGVATPLEIRAFAANANIIMIHGFVNSIV